jgi:hypothetical protein
MEMYKSSNENKDIKKDEDALKLEEYLHNVFIEYNNGQGRIDKILKELNPTIENNYFKQKFSQKVDIKELLKSLTDCAGIETEEKFVQKTFSLLNILLELKKLNPKDFEKVHRETFSEKFIRLNEILSYGKSGDTIHIHFADAKTLTIKEKINFFIDGLKKLALIVKDDEEIKQINGTSWIIAKNPKLIERFGFTYAGKIDEEMRDLHFRDEKEKVEWAYMERDEFLKKYLVK